MIISTSQHRDKLTIRGYSFSTKITTGISRSMFPESLEMRYERDWNVCFPTVSQRVSMGLEYLPINNPYHPWDWRIYLHEWLIFMVNVGRYTIHGCYGIY